MSKNWKNISSNHNSDYQEYIKKDKNGIKKWLIVDKISNKWQVSIFIRDSQDEFTLQKKHVFEHGTEGRKKYEAFSFAKNYMKTY